jgi:hypothetical protein
MWSRQSIPLLAATLLSAVTVTLLFAALTLAQIEEPWNIVVAAEATSIAKLTFVVALAHTLLLGVPLFVFMRSIGRVGIVYCALGGFIVGAAPFAVLTLISTFQLDNASTGGVATVVNGVPTLAGWIEYFQNVGLIGLFGLAGGLTFWSTLRLSGQFVSGADEGVTEATKLRRRSWSLASIAAIASLTLFFLPSVVRDNSCHNLFRDGRTSVGPQIYAYIKLPDEDWPTFTRMFTDFGAKHSLSLRSDEQIQHGNLQWRSLSLCNAAGVTIDVADRRWLTQIHSPMSDRGIEFSIYELKADSGWNPLAQELLEEIEMTWPSKTTFEGPNGRALSKQEALKGRN